MAIKILMTLALTGLLLPVAAQYAAASFLLLWWIYQLIFKRQASALQTARQSELRHCFRPVIYGVLTNMLLTSIAAVVAFFLSPHEQSAGLIAAKETYHLVAKQGVLGLVLIFSISRAYNLGFRIRQVLAAFAAILVLYSLYLVVQRYTGIDWVRGFAATLPENRFAYGAYRLSGMMGHPLSLAYNLVLLGVLSFGLLTLHWVDRVSRWIFIGSGVLACFALAISGSRWPFFVSILLMVGMGVRFFGFRWHHVAIFIVFLAIFFVFESAFLGRFKELLSADAPLIERFPRLVFWQVHWHIFTDNLFAGAGFGATEAVRLDYYAANGYTYIEHKFPAHNIFLQTLADSGILGLSGLLAWLCGATLSLARAAGNRRGRIIVWLISAVVLTGLFQNNLRDTEFLYAFWLCFVLLVCESVAAHTSSAHLGDYDRSERKSVEDRQPQPDQPDSRAYLPS